LEIILGLVCGLVFFIATIVAYSFGVKHGRIVKDGGVPNVNPVSVYKDVLESKESKKQMDLFSDGLNNILNFGEVLEERKGKG
jgi:hypothetical protein